MRFLVFGRIEKSVKLYQLTFFLSDLWRLHLWVESKKGFKVSKSFWHS